MSWWQRWVKPGSVLPPLVIYRNAQWTAIYLAAKEVNASGGQFAIDFPHLDGLCTLKFSWIAPRPVQLDDHVYPVGTPVNITVGVMINFTGPYEPTRLDG